MGRSTTSREHQEQSALRASTIQAKRKIVLVSSTHCQCWRIEEVVAFHAADPWKEIVGWCEQKLPYSAAAPGVF